MSTSRQFVYLSPWVYDSAEMMSLSDKAFRLWVCTLTWSMTHDTDGRMSFGIAKYLVGRSAKRCITELVDQGLWIPESDGMHYQAVRKLGFKELWRPGPMEGARRPILDSLRESIYERDGHACLACGATDRLTLHHIQHYSKGGRDTYENLRTLCQPCNSSRHTRTDEEWGRL